MLRSNIYRDNLWDDFFDDFFHETAHRPEPPRGGADLMRTDVKESEDAYELIMNLPGVKKENVKAELKDGYLTISASTKSDNDQKDGKGKYVRRERFVGSCSRAFYVGEAVKQEDIKAMFEDGTLILTVPKKVQQPVVEENKYITIE